LRETLASTVEIVDEILRMVELDSEFQKHLILIRIPARGAWISFFDFSICNTSKVIENFGQRVGHDNLALQRMFEFYNSLCVGCKQSNPNSAGM
jgi:hypothetical protein